MTNQSRSTISEVEQASTTAAGRDSTRLSWLAETADGWRDQKLQLIYHAVEGLSVKHADDRLKSGEAKVCDIETPSSQPNRVKVVSVTLETDDGTSHKFPVDPEGWDALFWSESSIAKFLYPYYQSHRIWGDDIETAKESFEEYPMAFAIRHKAPSASATMGAPATVEIGALGMKLAAGEQKLAAGDQKLAAKEQKLASGWYSPQRFNDLVSAYRVARDAARGGEGPAPGTP
jgi:hypothetical protein